VAAGATPKVSISIIKLAMCIFYRPMIVKSREKKQF
jgi:hypothetical protein